MRMQADRNRSVASPGFTLIEIIVVLAALAILAAIAYPSYLDSVRKAKRTESRAALFQLMQQQERYYTQHNTYIAFSASSIAEDEKKFKWFSGTSAKASAYEIKAEACDADTIQSCVQLTAMPGTGNVDSAYGDSMCGNLKLTSTGIKDADHPDCWR